MNEEQKKILDAASASTTIEDRKFNQEELAMIIEKLSKDPKSSFFYELNKYLEEKKLKEKEQDGYRGSIKL